MIHISTQMRIGVATEPIDFRVSVDVMAYACRKRLLTDPFYGALFVFRSRNSRP